MTDSLERRITCPRHHWNLTVTVEGIRFKCRAGECRMEYVVSWEVLEAKRQEVTPYAIVVVKQEIAQ